MSAPPTKIKTAPAVKRAKPVDARQVLDALHIQIKPVRAGPMYQLGLLLVAITMLVLPVIYLSMIGVLGYGIYQHAVHSVRILDTVHSRGALFLYCGPIVMGLIALGFMIKPLMARRVDDSVPLTLRRQDEPVLFEFVHRLCRTVGAPTPGRIDVDLDVNASAGFRGGWMSLFSRDLVLTFGLPLAAALDTRQFAGVLAHELGHFSQGSGMRLTYIIRRMNSWFARVVYRRDHWDVALYNLAHADHPGAALIGWLTIAMVWLARRVLWCLMLVGHGVSSFMLRQMEFNADRFQCRVSGSDSFGATFESIQCLGLSTAAAYSDLGAAWREKRLCDDLPALICSRLASMPTDVRTKLLQEQKKEKTGWFDSHPADAQRLASAQRENAEAMFTPRAPATILFTNFAELSRIATMLFYKKALGARFQPGHLTKTDNLVTARVEQQQTFDAMDTFFRSLIHPARPAFPHRLHEKPPKESQAAERLLELRSKLLAGESRAKAAAEKLSDAAVRAFTYAAARELRTAGFRKSGLEDPKLDAMSDDALKSAEAQANKVRSTALATLQPVVQIAIDRLNLALHLLEQAEQQAKQLKPNDNHDEYELADDPSPGTVDSLLSTIAVMGSAARDIETLEQHMLALKVLFPRVRQSGNPKALVEALLWHGRKASGLLRDIHRHLSNITYPYSESGRALSVCRYMIPALPPPNAVGEVASCASAAIDAYRSLYLRIMSDLTKRAIQLESDLGLPALDAPAVATAEKQAASIQDHNL